MAQDLAFRRMAPGDAAAVVALVNGAYRGAPEGTGWTHERDLVAGPRIDAAGLRSLDRPGSVVLVAERGGEVVGCVHLKREGGASCHLGMLSVRVGAQAGGIGRALLAEAERVAAEEMAATRVVMHVVSVRAELLAWYERRGYRRTGELVPFEPPPAERLLQGPLRFERLEKRLPR